LPKRKGRLKGSKNKPKAQKLSHDPNILKGNDDFKLTEEIKAKVAAHSFAAVTDEDLALDREIEALAAEQPQVNVSDVAPALEVKRTKDVVNHLKEIVDGYKEASTMAELTEQVHVAKAEGCDSIEASPTLVRQIFRKDYDYIEKNVGYGIYHDIRIYIAGHFDKHKGADVQTMEQRLFLGPKEGPKIK
jgi:hypothetical protein